MTQQILLVLIRAYPEHFRHLLTQPSDPDVGVTTSDDYGCW